MHVRMLKVGQFGLRSGEIFDDGPHSTVRQLVIHHSDGGIQAIKIEYDHNGSSFWSDLHGDDDHDNSKTDTIMLDYPEEFLTSVHAHYFKFWFIRGHICSISFNSNKRSYGPYGNDLGDYFSIKAPGRKIVGFHGNFSSFLGMRAIGAYLKPYDDDSSRALDHSSSSVVPQNNYQYNYYN